MTDKASLNLRIFCVSLLVLFLEILVIRWYSTEVRIFAYLHNMVLISAFLGMGMGCYAADWRCYPLASAAVLAVTVFLVTDPLHLHLVPIDQITSDLAPMSQVFVWYSGLGTTWLHVTRGLLLVMLLFLGNAFVFFPPGQMLGRWMNEHPVAVTAYSVNIAGSLLGVWLFNAISYWRAPPAIWFTVLALLYLTVTAGKSRVATALVLAIPVLCCATSAAPNMSSPQLFMETVWSPYQRLVLSRGALNGFGLEVNGVWYQSLMDLSQAYVQAHPDQFDKRLLRTSWYNSPWELKPGSHDSVLVVGAGSGNDVASALRAGARRVVAVEIDPAIVDIGRQFHPEHPYDDPRVEIVVDDARAYFRRCHEKFDVIRFGLLDSHTQASGFNNLRLDNYVYTLESFREAKRLLQPNGMIICGFSVQRTFMWRRLYAMLGQTFEVPPLLYSSIDSPFKDLAQYGPVGHCYYGGDQPTVEAMARTLSGSPEYKGLFFKPDTNLQNVTLTTDDWPYFYLEKPMVPIEYVAVSAIVLLLLLLLRKFVFAPAAGIDWPFFFLGAAFLLLEVHSISQSMLLFGTTWVVNSFVISAVLLLIFVANVVSLRLGVAHLRAVYGLLLGAVALQFVIPLSVFETWPMAFRAIGSSLFLCLPIFFYGIIFIKLFASSTRRDQALGSNLIGAILGGMLEALAFVWGMRVITLLVFLLYSAALATTRTRS